MNDALGDRMKAYETRESDRRLLPQVPVCARIDGRNFSSFTRDFLRPYDMLMVEAMIRTTEALVEETHARIGYTQSDEISLVWLAEKAESSVYFDHRVSKMTSVLASFATVSFCKALMALDRADLIQDMPHFDCRVWSVPTRSEAANVILWREMDATKNAINIATRSYYSHKEVDRKNTAQMQEMLFSIGVNFNDYPAFFKRGTYVRRETVERRFTDAERARIPEAHRPAVDTVVQRSVIRRMDMPRFASVTNRDAVIFGAEPVTEEQDA